MSLPPTIPTPHARRASRGDAFWRTQPRPPSPSRSHGRSRCTQAARAPRWIWESSAAVDAAAGLPICSRSTADTTSWRRPTTSLTGSTRWARSWGCRRPVASRGCLVIAACSSRSWMPWPSRARLLPSDPGRRCSGRGQTRLPRQADCGGRARLQDRRAERGQGDGQQPVLSVDFQTRANDFFVEAVRRVHAGAIGRFVFGEATYHAEDPFEDKAQHARSDDPEGRLRAWGLSASCRATSSPSRTSTPLTWRAGSWASPRVRVRHRRAQVPRRRHLLGHVQRDLQVPRQRGGYLQLAPVQRLRHAAGGHQEPHVRHRRRARDRGPAVRCSCGATVLQRGKDADDLRAGSSTNIAAFHDAIQKRLQNGTVAESVRSNLLTILGRTAA